MDLKVSYKEVKRNIIINANPEQVFAFMDDIENTGMHMTNTNAPLMGGKIKIHWLSENKTGLGAKYKWLGNVMGMKMDFTVEVTKWTQGKVKIWETTGNPKMIVLEWFRMFLLLSPINHGNTQAELSIYYTKSKGNILHFLLAKSYALWCVKSMLNDTKKHFIKKGLMTAGVEF